MHKCSKENNPHYEYCGLTEDNLHLFTKCPRIQQSWTHYQPILTKLIGRTYAPQQHLLTLNVKNVNKETKKLTLKIIQTMVYEIWETRNNLKYDNITLTTKTIISKINKHIETVLNSHFKKHKIGNTLILFEESLCINKAIAQLLDGQLKIPPPQ